MSKLVEGIKDRMVAAAREAAPTVMDAAQKAATAAAEAVTMMYALRPRDKQKVNANVVLVDESIFPQTLAVMTTRAIPQGITLRVCRCKEADFTADVFACILQYPNADGNVEDYRELVEKAHQGGCKVAVAADILSLALLTPPGEWGADIVFGSTQRLGTPLFYGGPSAAYFATRDEYKRNMCRAASSAGRKTSTANCATAWPCRPASNTSSGKRLHPTSAPHKPCSPLWLASMPYGMAPKAYTTLQHASTA